MYLFKVSKTTKPNSAHKHLILMGVPWDKCNPKGKTIWVHPDVNQEEIADGLAFKGYEANLTTTHPDKDVFHILAPSIHEALHLADS